MPSEPLRSACLLALLVTATAASRFRHNRKSASVQDEWCTGQSSTGELVRQFAKRRSESKVLMSKHEMAIIESYLEPSDSMLEWGSGFSTLWYSQFVHHYYSIEHDEGWYGSMAAQLKERDNVHYLNAPVVKGHKGWGGGIDEGTAAQFADYVRMVDDFQVPSFDKVLIDGRARVVCAEYVLKFLHKDSVVFVHDFTGRQGYHAPLEQYYTRVVQTFEGQSLAVFRPTAEALQMAANGGILTNFSHNQPV